MAQQGIRQNGQNFAKNVIDGYLYFETAQTWTQTTGTGSGILDNTVVFSGSNSLKVENTDPTTDLIVNNSTQSTTIDVGGDFDFSFFARKNDVNTAYTGAIEIYKNAVLYNTLNFTLGGDGSDDYVNKDYNQEWVRFFSDTPLSFVKSDVMTIRIKIDGISGFVDPSSVIWFDGLMLSARERGNAMPPAYNIPEGVDTVTDNLTANTLNLSELNTAPSSASDTGTLGQIRIDAEYIYVCTATDTWKRVALATW